MSINVPFSKKNSSSGQFYDLSKGIHDRAGIWDLNLGFSVSKPGLPTLCNLVLLVYPSCVVNLKAQPDDVLFIKLAGGHISSLYSSVSIL